jgi:hypothetical protein
MLDMSVDNESVNYTTILRRILHEEEKDYYLEVPFEMPEHTEELHVEIEIFPLGEGDTTIDLGLNGPSRVRGWSGGARTEFHVGTEKATPGYLPGELTPGQWSVLLGAYRIPKAGCNVKVHIRCKLEEYRWLKGDLHSHTVHSDGTYTLNEAVTVIEELGCDFIATTDHNTVSQNYAHPKDTNIVMIPGIELTTNQGHANFLGVIDPIEDFRVTSLEDIHKYIQTAKEKGAKVVLNHTHCDACPWEWDFEVDHDWVEVWNGPWMDRNQRALDWWQEQISLGRRITALGGSDTHRPDPFVKHAMPTTWVYASARTVAGILGGIDQRHVFISYAPEGPTIDFHIGEGMMGDLVKVEQDEPIEARIKLSHLKKGDKIKIISNQGTEKEIINMKNRELSHSWVVLNRLFYRIEIWRHFEEVDQTLMAALSNPIYLE